MNKCSLKISCGMLIFLITAYIPLTYASIGTEEYDLEWVADEVFFQPTTYPTSYYVSAVNETFFAYMRNDSGTFRFYVKVYNHTDKTMSNETYIGTASDNDRHFAPSIAHLPNGSLIIFYGSHSYVPGHICWRVSNGAFNVTSWFSEQHETGDFTYPHLCIFISSL